MNKISPIYHTKLYKEIVVLLSLEINTCKSGRNFAPSFAMLTLYLHIPVKLNNIERNALES